MVFSCRFEKPDSELSTWEKRQYIYAALMLYVQEKYDLTYPEARVFLSSVREEFYAGCVDPLGLSKELLEVIEKKIDVSEMWQSTFSTIYDYCHMMIEWDCPNPRVF